MHRLSDFQYTLPPHLIAREPAAHRDHSRLLVINRATSSLTDHHFFELPHLLQPGDVLVRNNSRVIKARLFGYKKQTGGRVELILNTPIFTSNDQVIYECLSRPGIKEGQEVVFGDGALVGTCCGTGTDGYTRHVRFPHGLSAFLAILDTVGSVPLPPYMHHSPEEASTFTEHYQTKYAKHPGSVAAPTAGLHFTPQLDQALLDRGVTLAEVTLHVGLGTFLPVKTDTILDHVMHEERYTLTPQTAQLIMQAKKEGRRIIAVGTTTCRVLESAATQNPDGSLHLQSTEHGSTKIFIFPPYRFKVLDGLITNFHLPESTLLMLVSAFVSQPQTAELFTTFAESLVGKAYARAIAQEYRFFSFGDASLLL